MIPEKSSQARQSVFRITILLVALVLWAFVTPITAFFWNIFLVWWVFRLDSRILGWVAIGFLILIPVVQYFNADDRAEQVAVYVYFLLVMIVTLQIIEFRREGGEESGSQGSVDSDKLVETEKVGHAKTKVWF